MSSRKSFDQGRSTGEAEGTPLYGGPDQFRRVSGGVDGYMGAAELLPADSGRRNEPVNGNIAPERHEVMGTWALRAAENLAEPQMAHGLTRLLRGMPDKQDYPDGGSKGPPQGKIKAVHQHDYGLGPAYARPGPGDPVNTTAPTDYFRRPAGPLDRYMGAKELLPSAEYGSGIPREYTRSRFPTMGDDLIAAAGKAARRAGQ
jgi:hypothetical protein